MKYKEKKLFFYPVTKKHLELIHHWLKKDHVKIYFHGEGLKNTLKNLDLFTSGIRDNGNYTFDHWIAYIEKEPLGFLMTSPVTGPFSPDDDYDKWYEEGKKTITLDLLIGEEKFLGHGLGKKMIQDFLLDKFSQISYVLIDPSATNTKAIHVYESVGFKKLEQFLPGFDPTPHWMMKLDMNTLRAKNI